VRAPRLTSSLRGGRPAGRPGEGGLTLIELIMVMLLLGILFSLTVASAVGLTPIYRVRSASRTIGAQIEELRALAISRGQPMGIRYTMLDDPHFYQMIPPAPDDFPEEPLEARHLGVKTELPSGVRFRSLSFPGGKAIDRGVVNVLFSPMGNTGSHVLTLEGKKKDGSPILVSVKFNAITGAIDFVQGEAELISHAD
jgi:prepilin-type N-terminal cleavage/methylation domain-containing protein